MSMALLNSQTYLIWSINDVDMGREVMNTSTMGEVFKLLRYLNSGRDVVKVRMETVKKPDIRNRAARRRNKTNQVHGPNRQRWNKR